MCFGCSKKHIIETILLSTHNTSGGLLSRSMQVSIQMQLVVILLYLSCRLLITFAKSLDPDQAWDFVGPDLDPICYTLRWYHETGFWNNNNFVILKKKNSMENYPACKEFMSSIGLSHFVRSLVAVLKQTL